MRRRFTNQNLKYNSRAEERNVSRFKNEAVLTVICIDSAASTGSIVADDRDWDAASETRSTSSVSETGCEVTSWSDVSVVSVERGRSQDHLFGIHIHYRGDVVGPICNRNDSARRVGGLKRGCQLSARAINISWLALHQAGQSRCDVGERRITWSCDVKAKTVYQCLTGAIRRWNACDGESRYDCFGIERNDELLKPVAPVIHSSIGNVRFKGILR